MGNILFMHNYLYDDINDFIIADSVVLWKIQKFDWLIPETR